MDSRRLVSELLATLGQALGFDGFALADDGTVTLRFDERIMLLMAVEEPSATLLLLTPLPAPDTTGLRKALLANFLWRGTGGATLALEPTTGQLALQQRLPLAGLDYPTFTATLEAFIEEAERQRLELEPADEVPAPLVGFDPRFIV